MTPEQASRRRLWRLHTKTSVEDGNPILFVEGRLGHAATAELETVAREHASSAAGKVIIDLSGVDYLSGAALKVFKTLADRQAHQGGRLCLRAPSVSARLALELAGLLDLIDS